ncbi:hypothetical protein [Neorhodopirellula pilleata]|uniref:Uncharacterized protein n=1 Tax=Neorhodopirellula pilleata TaxID=2714738 RepID=A0A5C6AD02_9BACT|nr:hypothetical protein [Neorhodopirellula pilleata]TWT97178.1 hypothetical protein Pla100_23280 [Neorhodopirellula pilleata]
MTTAPTVRRNFHVAKVDRGERRIRPGAAPPRPTAGRLPRLARIMALAIHFDRALFTGRFQTQADLARAGQVTRARLTQILNLTCLAPDIQEQLLHLPAYTEGRAPLTERDVRPIAAEPNWAKQRSWFAKLSTQRSLSL